MLFAAKTHQLMKAAETKQQQMAYHIDVLEVRYIKLFPKDVGNTHSVSLPKKNLMEQTILCKHFSTFIL